MTESIVISGRSCRLFGAEKPACLLIQPSARHEAPTLEEEVRQLTALTAVPFLLVTIELEDWIVDLMPWADRNISRDEEAGKHGQDTLQYILQSLIPWLEERYGFLPAILGGYSLGGLYALWASARTDRFRAVAAASPSVWIKDWVPYAKKNVPGLRLSISALASARNMSRIRLSPVSAIASAPNTGCCRNSWARSIAPWSGKKATTSPIMPGGWRGRLPGAS